MSYSVIGCYEDRKRLCGVNRENPIGEKSILHSITNLNIGYEETTVTSSSRRKVSKVTKVTLTRTQ